MRVLVNPETDKDLIIYNHLFSRDTDYKFTTDVLQKDLKQYKLVLTLNEVHDIINWYIEKGLVYQHFRYYSTKGYYDKSRRTHRGLFVTNTGIRINSDVNGSLQILKRGFETYFKTKISSDTVLQSTSNGLLTNPIKVNLF